MKEKHKLLKNVKYTIILILFFVVFPFFIQGALPAPKYLTFIITVNPDGQIDRDGNGLYFILFNNSTQELINATDNRTFTDFICFNGINTTWYHRRTDPLNLTFFIWEPAGIINTNCYVSPDNKQLILQFNVNDKSIFLNQYISQDNFNAHAVTTDSSSRFKFDTLGQGPSMINNSINTLRVNKQIGVIPPIPVFYPADPVVDTAKFEKLPKSFPYVNFDIVKFEVVAN